MFIRKEYSNILVKLYRIENKGYHKVFPSNLITDFNKETNQRQLIVQQCNQPLYFTLHTISIKIEQLKRPLSKPINIYLQSFLQFRKFQQNKLNLPPVPLTNCIVKLVNGKDW